MLPLQLLRKLKNNSSILQINFIILMSLDQEMTRYFEYMRPRYSNPTYSSSNVGFTLGLLHTPPQFTKSPTIRAKSKQPQTYLEPQIQQTLPNQLQPKTQLIRHKKSNSQLSNYGTSSLARLPKYNNEREIYEKQQKKYNIISIQPKKHHETIKKYPKFHLENLDGNYYKKLELQNQYDQQYQPKKYPSQPANPETKNQNPNH